MQYVCDAPDGKTWFRMETEGEAAAESQAMDHAVEKYFRQEKAKATDTFKPASSAVIEQNIGLNAHIQRTMPLFLTLRDSEGTGHATAMLAAGGRDDPSFRIIIVGKANSDPYPAHEAAISALGKHFGLSLDYARCFPYAR